MKRHDAIREEFRPLLSGATAYAAAKCGVASRMKRRRFHDYPYRSQRDDRCALSNTSLMRARADGCSRRDRQLRDAAAPPRIVSRIASGICLRPPIIIK